MAELTAEQVNSLLHKLCNLPSQITEMKAMLLSMKCDITDIKSKQQDASDKLHHHDVDLAIIQEWRDNQARPAVAENTERVVDMRVELTKVAVQSASFAGTAIIAAGIIAAILKAVGVF